MTLYRVTLARFVRETATVLVEADDSINDFTADENAIAEAVYAAESGELAEKWEVDEEYGATMGLCEAEIFHEKGDPVEPDAFIRDTDCYLEVRFTR